MVTMPAAPDWRTTYADKLMTPAEAMAIVAPGDAVWTGVLNSVPSTLCAALAAGRRRLLLVRRRGLLQPRRRGPGHAGRRRDPS